MKGYNTHEHNMSVQESKNEESCRMFDTGLQANFVLRKCLSKLFSPLIKDYHVVQTKSQQKVGPIYIKISKPCLL